MKSLFYVSGSILLFMGCSHSRFVLHDPGREGSASDSRRVEVSSRDRLSILFRADGEIHGIDTVNAVAADGQHLLVSSEEWKTVRQIPRRYLSMSGLRVRSPNSDHDRPTVALPVASIEEIRIEDRDLRWPSVLERMGQAPRMVSRGGRSAGSPRPPGSIFMHDRYDRWQRDPEDLSHGATSTRWDQRRP